MQLLKLSEKYNKCLFDIVLKLSDSYPLKPNLTKRYYVDFFDKEYLNFIFNRQKRDLFLVNEFYKYFISQCSIKSNLLKKMEINCDYLSLNFKKNSVIVNDTAFFKSVARENKDLLEKNIFYLKTLNELRLKINLFQCNDAVMVASLNAKMRKVASINDNSFLDTITANKKLQKEIIAKLPKIKSFNDIKADVEVLKDLLHQFNI